MSTESWDNVGTTGLKDKSSYFALHLSQDYIIMSSFPDFNAISLQKSNTKLYAIKHAL